MFLSAPARWIKYLLLSTAMTVSAAHAEPIYKCESAGHVTYSDKGCSTGQKMDILLPDKTLKNTETSAGADKKALQALQREREKEEQKNQKLHQQARRQLIQEQNRAHKHERKCALLLQRKKAVQEDIVQIPLGKNETKARLKKQRTRERLEQQYQQECTAADQSVAKVSGRTLR